MGHTASGQRHGANRWETRRNSGANTSRIRRTLGGAFLFSSADRSGWPPSGLPESRANEASGPESPVGTTVNRVRGADKIVGRLGSHPICNGAILARRSARRSACVGENLTVVIGSGVSVERSCSRWGEFRAVFSQTPRSGIAHSVLVRKSQYARRLTVRATAVAIALDTPQPSPAQGNAQACQMSFLAPDRDRSRACFPRWHRLIPCAVMLWTNPHLSPSTRARSGPEEPFWQAF